MSIIFSRTPTRFQSAHGLHYLHNRQEPIIHRDMTAPNVLLQQITNGLWKAKIADFGSANLAHLSNTAGEGNILYTAPEIHPLTSDEHTTKIDVFSYGILLCEVVNAKLPEVLKDLLYRRSEVSVSSLTHPHNILHKEGSS